MRATLMYGTAIGLAVREGGIISRGTRVENPASRCGISRRARENSRGDDVGTGGGIFEKNAFLLCALTIIASLGFAGLGLTSCSDADDGSGGGGGNLANTSWKRTYSYETGGPSSQTGTKTETLTFTAVTLTVTVTSSLDPDKAPSVTTLEFSVSGGTLTVKGEDSSNSITYKITGNILALTQTVEGTTETHGYENLSPKAQSGDPLAGTSWTNSEKTFTSSIAGGVITSVYADGTTSTTVYGIDTGAKKIITLNTSTGGTNEITYAISGNTLTLTQGNNTVTYTKK